MDRVLGAYGYGIALFSLPVLQDFLKTEKIRSKKLLTKLQKDKELYLKTQKQGILFPIVQIDAGGYIVKLAGFDEPFDEDWELKLAYDGFNIDIRESLCISDLEPLDFYNADSFDKYENSSQTMDGKTYYNSFKYDMPSGKYLITVKGYARKSATGHTSSSKYPEYGFFFSLTRVEIFDGFKNPRESELYEFNIAWLTRSREAVVEWFSEEDGGLKNPPTESSYYAVIKLTDESLCHLHIEFDHANHCRVCILWKNTLDYLLDSGQEHILYEETRKRGKSQLQKIGRLIMK
ncbi:MAG: hypothetical protein K2N95_00550 [Lachnospiraceae bacterium]|nr:hypothetical protein [Lachnospiraceae bacterium]